jgi:thiamine biosynthesis lipoprotein
MATSGNYRRYTEINGVKYAHHIDPHTGYPTQNNLLSASVFAADCISADAYATGLLVMGLEKAKTFLQQHSELQAYLIYSDEQGQFQIYQTPGLQYILTETE